MPRPTRDLTNSDPPTAGMNPMVRTLPSTVLCDDAVLQYLMCSDRFLSPPQSCRTSHKKGMLPDIWPEMRKTVWTLYYVIYRLIRKEVPCLDTWIYCGWLQLYLIACPSRRNTVYRMREYSRRNWSRNWSSSNMMVAHHITRWDVYKSILCLCLLRL